ncbi:tyrosine-type recombinase/integrase [Geomonas propionica]|uniref:Site-specific integrase n=1 Tax=Geomonas propionica TaxID=2798582 RepID=A0ABS0YQM4_9BACT|nr:site-specific integrase [Geomonas propionica]MBJ6799762.1 site-specific integrase [Geomonas propionica]
MSLKTKFGGKFTDIYLDTLRKEIAKTPPPKEVDIREVKGSPGFGIRVRKTGVITFFYMYHFGGKRRMLILGSYNDPRSKVTLSEARQKYNDAIAQVGAGVDPMAKPTTSATDLTVDKVAAEFLEKYSQVYYSPRWHQTVSGVLKNYVLPKLGGRPIKSISRRDIIPILESLLVTKPGQARNTHKALSMMLWFAEDREYIPSNPHTKMTRTLPNLSVPEGKDRFLDDQEIVKVWRRIDRGPGEDSTKRALKFILVTGQRPEEVSSMHRKEINGRWWTIPWSRIKTENKKTLRRKPQDHRVYLSDLAMSLLGDGTEYIFPSFEVKDGEDGLVRRERGPVSRNSLSQRVARGYRCERRKGQVVWFEYYGRPTWTPHDLRRSAKSGMSRINIPKDWSKKVLNHKDSRIDGTYDLHDYDDQKQEALTRWSAHLESLLNLKKPEQPE